MAKMYPRTVPEVILKDKNRSAEIRIYDLLKEQLPDTFACYYSRPWHRFTPSGAEQDGEADFVVVNPDLGMLIIEVKGGRVSCRAGDGQWVSVDRYDIAYEIKNPIEQAKRSKYRFRDLLKNSRDWQERRFPAFHAAILPDSVRPQNPLGADAPLELFAFGNDLPHLGTWITSRMQSLDMGSLGSDGAEAIHRILASKFELRPHLARAISDDIRHIERLTAEQSWILDSLEDNPQMTVSGPAGTGKTVLALEKAMRSASSGRRVLFTCYNSALAAHLRHRCGKIENLTISSFHSLCGSFAEAAGRALSLGAGSAFYDRILPEALVAAVEAKPDLGFETIVIDEGQDFRDDWMVALRLCLRDHDNDEFYVFYDDNQRIFSADRLFLSSLPQSTYRLNRNLRNTKSIHRVLTPWYDQRKITAVGPEGTPVEWIETKDRQQSYAQAGSIVANLIKTNQLAASEIAVLTGGRLEECALFKASGVGATRYRGAEERGLAEYVTGDTVRRFKGLEAKCVILIDTDLLHEAELAYVGLSRAVALLYVIGRKEDLRRLRND
ncbi:NERD domain-containing protein [Rhizobium sp.]|uniref:NERD domain-containing protein n=1 Tax=Rhizobium sp. TaxID=391 RepID=UPI0028AE7257